MSAVVLLGASALGRDLGLPMFVAGAAVTVIVLLIGRQSPMRDADAGGLLLVLCRRVPPKSNYGFAAVDQEKEGRKSEGVYLPRRAASRRVQ